jgi:hypothetical protein
MRAFAAGVDDDAVRFVIAGLDLGIHAAVWRARTVRNSHRSPNRKFSMDHRVKSGGDEGRDYAFSLLTVTTNAKSSTF